jgi:SOS-response transcriptional repressor LexA
VYVVATNEGAVLKRVYDEGDSFRLVSYNKEYQDYLVNKADVYGIYSVVGLIRI